MRWRSSCAGDFCDCRRWCTPQCSFEVEHVAGHSDVGDGISWADSVLLMVKGKAHPFPGGGKVTADRKPLILKAGESVSAELDVLPVEGVEWSRLYFNFVIGEKLANNFCYYFSAVHDSMRGAAVKRAVEGK